MRLLLAIAVAACAAASGCIQVNIGPPAPAEGNAVDHSAHQAPALDVEATPEIGRSGRPVTFQALADGLDGRSVDTWSWDFGDGETAAGADLARVSHTYATAGDYDVVLRVQTTDGQAAQATLPLIVTN